MDTLPYRQAFDRIRSEYLEMPGMRLTPRQVHRLSGVDIGVCKVVLNDLIRAQFLQVASDGSYVRGWHANPVQPRAAKAAMSATLPSRRAS